MQYQYKPRPKAMTGERPFMMRLPKIKALKEKPELVLRIVEDLYDGTPVKKTNYRKPYNTANRTLEKVLKSMGLDIADGKFIDLNGWYPGSHAIAPGEVPEKQPGTNREQTGNTNVVCLPGLEGHTGTNREQTGNKNGFIHTERKLKRKHTSPSATCDDLKKSFDAIWRDYPGYLNGAGKQEKGSRKKAWEKFQKVTAKQGTLDAIQAAITQMKIDFPEAKTKNAFRPALVVWLNQARWEEFETSVAINPADLPHDPSCNLKGVIVVDGQPRGFCSHCKARRTSR